MALKPGTLHQFHGSLADEIEGAFAAEFYALKSKELPATGADERRVLFAAIAQAVLSYLAANASDLAVTVGSGAHQQTGNVQVNASWLSVSLPPFGTAGVQGGGFPANASVTLTWEEPHAPITTLLARGDGTFSLSLPYAGRTGWQVVSAVDGAGNRAIATVNIG